MPLSWTIDHYDCVESTQDILKEKASQGANEGLVVVATEQSAGRGRHGNVWSAPKGNLYMSFLLRPDCTPSDAGQYSFLIAVALSSTLDEFMSAEHEKKLKWPNDVLINNKKIAGILLESDLSPQGKVSDLYIGVGVNILNSPEGKISVSDISEKTTSVEYFLNLFLKKISEYYDLYNKNGFKEIKELWVSQAYKLGQEISVRLPNETLKGVFEGVDENGTLLLQLDNGERQLITAGEVYF